MSTLETLLTLHRAPSPADYYAARAQHTRIADTYRLLSLDAARNLAAEALKLLDSGAAKEGEAILRHLACFVPGSLRDVQTALAERLLLTSPQLYYRAGEEARDTLLRKLARMEADMSSMKSDLLDGLLKALAWIGDKAVQAQFFQWWLMPPRWRTLLPIAPHEYARAAGWHLTKDGSRRSLTYPDAYELLRLPDDATPPAGNPVSVGVPAAEPCPSGQGSALILFDFDLASRHPVFMGLRGERLRILTCTGEVQDGPVYTEVDVKGGSRWLTSIRRIQHLPQDAEQYPVDRMVLGNPRHTAFEMLSRGTSDSLVGLSGLGGYPTWLNGAVYPEEPFAGRPMLFAGQVAAADLLADPAAPGMFYAFLNEDATIAATYYQEK